MKREWTHGLVGVLLGLALFLAGCAERKADETTSQAPMEQAPSVSQGGYGGDQGTVSAPTDEQGGARTTKEQTPSKQKKERLG